MVRTGLGDKCERKEEMLQDDSGFLSRGTERIRGALPDTGTLGRGMVGRRDISTRTALRCCWHPEYIPWPLITLCHTYSHPKPTMASRCPSGGVDLNQGLDMSCEQLMRNHGLRRERRHCISACIRPRRRCRPQRSPRW